MRDPRQGTKGGVEVVDDHQRDHTRHTGGTRGYEHGAGPDNYLVHQQTHATGQSTYPDGGTYHGQALHRHRCPRSDGGIPGRQPNYMKDPDLDISKIQSVLCHGMTRNKTGRIADRGTAKTATSASPDPSSIICHNYGKTGHYRSGCAVPAKAHGKSNKPPGQKEK